MNGRQLFGGFSDAEQEKLAVEAERRWGSEVRKSNDRWKNLSAQEQRAILAEGNAVYTALIEAMPEGAASPKAQALVARWHAHIENFWSPDESQLLGLAELYNSDPAFLANFEAMKPGLAAFMKEAVRIYVAGRK